MAVNPAVLSLVALLVVIVVSLTSRINVGLLAIALGWLVAVFGAGWRADAFLATFPGSLFITLFAVTLLFGIAEKNGTLAALTSRLVGAWGRRATGLPWLYFFIAGALSSLGPGAIAATAVVAPLAMAAGAAAGVSPFLMALMVANGANAGNLSPWSSVGIVVHTQMVKANLPGHEAGVFVANFVAHAIAAAAAFALFKRRARLAELVPPAASPAAPVEVPVARRVGERLPASNYFTLTVLAAWIVAVVAFNLPPGPSAIVAAVLLVLARTVDEKSALSSVPVGVVLMVCGVSMLIAVLEKTGGMDLFTTLLSRLTSPALVNGVMAGVTGLISTYSSTSGVVYPAFLPAVPGLVDKLGGGDPLQIALSINVGAALVDVSPLSTIGALCLAALPPGYDAARLFRELLAWGFAMVLAGAVFCQLFIRWFAW
jgi:Na+/H+ antiporter NhaD/arsenite permease-like protein